MSIRLKLLASVAILTMLAATIDVRAALAALTGVEPAWAAAASVLFFLTHAVNALRLRVVVPDRTVGILFAYTLVAQGYALLLPGQIAGEAMKAYRLGRSGGGLVQAASAVAFDKVAGIAGVLLLTFAVGLGETGRFGPAPAAASGVALAALAAAAVAATWGGAGRTMRAALAPQGAAAWRSGLADRLMRFLMMWRSHAVRPATVGLSLLGAVAAQVVAVAGTQALGLGFGIDLPFAVWGVVLGALTVILMAPVTVGGVGLREISLVGLLGLLGVPASQALAMGLAILAFQAMVAVLGLAADILFLRRQ